MNFKEITSDIYYVGVNDRATTRFEAMWPLPYGVSYNSYLVSAGKTALIDTVEVTEFTKLIDNIESIASGKGLDYLVINHMEPDHSGSIPALVEKYPGMKLVCNRICADQVAGFYHIDDPEKFIIVKDGDTLGLDGLTLRFVATPMVHWPETMMTYVEEKSLLFAGDAFGCFGALNGKFIDSDLTDCELETYISEMYRYYSNIVGKYGKFVQGAFKKLAGTDIKYVCSTHGPIWHKHFARVADIYNRLSLYEPEEGTVVVYASMYGNTAEFADRIVNALAEKGMHNICVFNAATAELSDMISACFRYRTLVIGSPTYSMDIFPPVAALLRALAIRETKNKTVGIFGSYTWASGALPKLKEAFEAMGIPPVASITMKQSYSPAIDSEIDAFAAAIADASAAKL